MQGSINLLAPANRFLDNVHAVIGTAVQVFRQWHRHTAGSAAYVQYTFMRFGVRQHPRNDEKIHFQF